jgi:hypothetical protein
VITNLTRLDEPLRGRAGIVHQRAPVVTSDRPGGVRRADRRAGPPLVEQVEDRLLQAGVDSAHPTSLSSSANPEPTPPP